MKRTFIAAVLGLLLLPAMASAYDEGTPAQYTLRWIVPSDTTFSITLCGAESQVDFDDNLDGATQEAVQPDCQDNSTGAEMMNITNDGNVNMNFTANLTASKPSWATLYVNNDTSFATATTFDMTAVLIEDDVDPGDGVETYFWTSVSGATQGTTSKTLQINGVSAT